jgi:hypothetical protein
MCRSTRADMAKSKLWVRQLTLPPLSDVGLEGSEDPRDEEEEERRTLRETEHMARAVDLSIFAGEGKQPRPSVHGVEPTWGSKFWVAGDDDESSNEEETTTRTLVDEAIAAGFTIEQIRQAEDEQLYPASVSSEVSAKAKEGSLSTKIVQLWTANRKSKVKPWCGPLPSPRQSPLRTFGDAMAKAKITPKKKGPEPYAMKDHHRGCSLLMDRMASRSYPAKSGQGLRGGNGDPRPYSDERWLEPPVIRTVQLLTHSKDAAPAADSISNLDRQGVVNEA